MSKATKGVLIVNLGTPDSTQTKDVRKYLREFLMDWRVIDIPAISRWLLVNCIIAPFRAPKSAKIYKEVWTDKGSPLLYIGKELKEKLQEQLGADYLVSFGMRYQNPSVKSSMKVFKNKGFKELVVIPMYPQYASASTGSTIEAINKELSDWQVIPSTKVISNFVAEPTFIDAWEAVAKPYLENEMYDHFVFSYHGLPERQIKKASCDGYCQVSDKCCGSYNQKNFYCYRAQCFETTRQIVKRLGISEENYSVCFQSRLGKEPWIEPYIDDAIDDIIAKGKKRVLAFSPAFVTDCLETNIEIGEEYQEVFLEKGGEKWQLVQSLNTHPKWVDCLETLVKK